MKKIFKSKVDLNILLPLSFLLAAAEVFMIFQKIVIGEIVIGMVMAFLIYLFMDTFYEMTKDDKLKIKSGFFFQDEIYIKSIKKVRPIRNHGASPALSSDRLEIRYNRYGRVLVSPNNKTEFIRELKQVNPRIRVE